MMPIHPVRCLPALLVILTLAACSGDPAQKKPTIPTKVERSKPLRAMDDPRVQAHIPQMQRVEALLTRWDALRADGRVGEAEQIAPQIGREVDADFSTFLRATQGELGPHAQYLAVSAMGFSRSDQATRTLLARLTDKDSRLVGNALIALSVRADPNTPLDALLLRIAPVMPLSIKQFAPVALANVLEARMRARLPADKAREQIALGKLGSLVTDHDAIVRLHTAKALGALQVPGTLGYLRVLAGDPNMRVRWSAAAGLERHGERGGFPEVIRLLSDVAPESKPVIRDVLVSYAGKLQGRALTQSEIASLGTGPRAWSQWFNQLPKAAPR